MVRAPLLVTLLLAAALAGCIGDETTGDNDVAYVEPTYEDLRDVPATITGVGLLGDSDVPGGAGIWVDGDFAYVGARNDGFYVADISDPTNPVVVGSVPGLNDVTLEEGGIYGRDVDLLTYEDGRKVAVVAGQSAGFFFIDVTDPTTPEMISVISNDDIDGLPTHNVDVVTGTHYVFNAPSGGEGRTNHLINASNPDEPVIVGAFGNHGCHDITFYMNDEEEKYRAYCAGRDVTEIWDLSDIENPKLLTSLNHVVVDNGQGLHHLAMVNQDASLLIIGDEFRGGGGPGCQANVGEASTPIGALWFFDITGDKELAPEEVGSFSPTIPLMNTAASNDDYVDRVLGNPTAAPQPNTSCTSHFGEFVADTDVLAMAWYQAGVVLIDLSDPSSPKQIGQFNQGTSTWDVKFHRGVLVTGDMTRGLDVLELL